MSMAWYMIQYIKRLLSTFIKFWKHIDLLEMSMHRHVTH